MNGNTFRVGQIVRLKAMPEITGRIEEALPREGKPRYRIVGTGAHRPGIIFRYEAELEAVWEPAAGQLCSYTNVYGKRTNATVVHIDKAGGKAWVRTRLSNLIVPTSDLAPEED